MKSTATQQRKRKIDPRSAKILKALREARKAAVKSARMHGLPISYLKNGKLIRERV
ncbi:MAG TPA: hypothetical protein VGE41_05425 [Verrucomicrobiae bacterium]|jgi:hypothetical protein